MLRIPPLSDTDEQELLRMTRQEKGRGVLRAKVSVGGTRPTEHPPVGFKDRLVRGASPLVEQTLSSRGPQRVV
jgi:hypothetical protein